jgi:hypothetical protein
MNPITKDFISDEPRKFRFKVGKILASSLSGFIAGIIVASVIWIVGIWCVQLLQNVSSPTLPNLVQCAYTKAESHFQAPT